MVEHHVDPAAPLTVYVQVEGMESGREARCFEQQIGQLRVNAALGEGLWIERTGSLIGQGFRCRQRGPEGQRQARQQASACPAR